ncbi:YcxB family protein [Rhizobium halophytocola]|uniref:YcxB-like C-terminal domain-containing protein n=1 Tax=Rhizobium halophytocola TaxID=735519 RepID=A0ABS4DXB9_9HYPH|nr:YcxB family protein [Rhizobium halophytocola]MBP1850315.1 hypothetical protein [Rhizobium halophytocola]
MASAQAGNRFEIQYDEDLLRRAVRVFVWRRCVLQQKTLWVIGFLTAGFLAAVAPMVSGEPNLLPLLAVVAAALPFVVTGLLWNTHHADTLGRFRNLPSKTAEVTVDETGIAIRSGPGQRMVGWPFVIEIWETDGFFMVFTGQYQFETLPKHGMPLQAVTRLRARAAAAEA